MSCALVYADQVALYTASPLNTAFSQACEQYKSVKDPSVFEPFEPGFSNDFYMVRSFFEERESAEAADQAEGAQLQNRVAFGGGLSLVAGAAAWYPCVYVEATRAHRP